MKLKAVNNQLRLLNIDIIRIISLLIVMASHYNLEKFDNIDGTHGVVLFFFISGFCISMTSPKRKNFWDFWKARLIRLLPTLIACAATVTVFKWIFRPVIHHRMTGLNEFVLTSVCIPTLDIPCIIKNLLLEQHDYNFVDGSYWSLLVEFRFYFLFGLIF